MTPHGVPQTAPLLLRLLIFEDREDDVILSVRTLRSAGFDVTADAVCSLQKLEDRLRRSVYDVILADYRVPNATGIDAFQIVKSLGLHIPFILVTGSLGDEMAVECVKQGISDYVLKDHIARLPSAVQRALEEQRLRRDRDRAQEALRLSEDQLRRQNRALEEQNRRVEAASRMKNEFVANMSHELRSPLNSIIGFGELIHDGKLGPLAPSQTECLARILNGAHHLLRLINDILDLARIEAGKLEFRPESVSLSQLVQETCDSFATLAAEKHIRLSHQVDVPSSVTIDPARFKQVLYNYLSNALKFTDSGSVTVTVQPEGEDTFRLEVADSGVGISESDLSQLFTDFHQLDSGKNKRFQGAGLGLALTRRIVEAQGGRVGVHSILGQGSTFFAVLPRVAAGDLQHAA
jgi:signal transduction histidine kinase